MLETPSEILRCSLPTPNMRHLPNCPLSSGKFPWMLTACRWLHVSKLTLCGTKAWRQGTVTPLSAIRSYVLNKRLDYIPLGIPFDPAPTGEQLPHEAHERFDIIIFKAALFSPVYSRGQSFEKCENLLIVYLDIAEHKCNLSPQQC